MSIEHTCPSCQIRLRVADESAGKKVRCKCGAVSAVPAAASAAASSAQAQPAHPSGNRAAPGGASPSITVTCASCQQTLRAPQSAAGKAVRCKCGQIVQVPGTKLVTAASQGAPPPVATRTAAVPAAVPAARPAVAAATAVAARQLPPTRAAGVAAAPPIRATPQPAAARASIFDELTDADWNRESPVKRAYAPPTASKDGAVLRQFVGKEMPAASVNRGGTPGGLIALSIINFLWGGLFIVGGIALVALVQVAAVVEQLQAALPVLRAAVWFACAFLLFWGVISVVVGVGLLQKAPWGWCVAGVAYAQNVISTLYNLVTSIIAMADQVDPARIAGMFLGVGITIAIAAYIYKDSTRRHFGIKTMTPVIICAVAGVLVSVASIAVLSLLPAPPEA